MWPPHPSLRATFPRYRRDDPTASLPVRPPSPLRGGAGVGVVRVLPCRLHHPHPRSPSKGEGGPTGPLVMRSDWPRSYRLRPQHSQPSPAIFPQSIHVHSSPAIILPPPRTRAGSRRTSRGEGPGGMERRFLPHRPKDSWDVTLRPGWCRPFRLCRRDGSCCSGRQRLLRGLQASSLKSRNSTPFGIRCSPWMRGGTIVPITCRLPAWTIVPPRRPIFG